MTGRGSITNLKGILFKEPYHYKHRVVNSLENLTYLAEESNKISSNCLSSFDGIQSELQDASEKIVSANSDEMQKSREQAAQLAAETGFAIEQLSSTVSYGLSEVNNSIVDSGNKVVESIDKATLILGYQLSDVNRNLVNINRSIQVSNSMLSFIAGTLEEIRRLMTIPNEVEALELADQARINFALGKNDKALEMTQKAMELCSTSIPVTAYHIIALSSQTSNDFFHEIKNLLKDYANLISFKLLDKGTDEKLALLDTTTMTYPILHTISLRYGATMIDSAKEIYRSISVSKKAACKFVELGLTNDECASMINIPTIFRELHWSTSLNVLTDESVSLNNFASYFNKINFDSSIGLFFDRIKESRSPIRGEIQLVLCKFLHANNYIRNYFDYNVRPFLSKHVMQDGRAFDVKQNIISYLLKLEPQDQYNHDRYTKTMIAEYITNNNTSLSPQFEAEIQGHINKIQTDINTFYVPALESEINKNDQGERQDILQLEEKFGQILIDIESYNTQCEEEVADKRTEQKRILQQICYNEKVSQKGNSDPDNAKLLVYGIFFGLYVWFNVMAYQSGARNDDLTDTIFLMMFAFPIFLGIPTICLALFIGMLVGKAKEGRNAGIQDAVVRLKSLHKNKDKINADCGLIELKQRKYITTKKESIEYYREKRESSIEKARQRLDNLLRKKIIEKYYSLTGSDHHGNNPKICNVSFDDFLSNSLISPMVKKVNNEHTLALSTDYKKQIDIFLAKIR